MKTLQIKHIGEEYLDEIIRIDEETFNHEELRSIANLKAIRMSDPDCCFVIMDKNKLWAITTPKHGQRRIFRAIGNYK